MSAYKQKHADGNGGGGGGGSAGGAAAAKNYRELVLRLVRSGGGLLLLTWALAIVIVSVTTHPCWSWSSSSQCLAAFLISGSPVSSFSNRPRSLAVKTTTTTTTTTPPASPPPSADASPAAHTTRLEDVVFGIAASADLWRKRREYVKLWWKPGRTRGYVWLDRNVSDASGDVPLRVSEDTSRFKFTHPEGVRSAVRVARIVLETFRLGLPRVRWFVMGDDDTVFFTENLLRVLSKYDHTKLYYLGCNSESVDQNAYHSFNMAYGGGGFALSYPLARALAAVLDGCIDRYHGLYGSDQRVQACLAELGVPLTPEPGFHQFDVRGNLFGLLAAHPVSAPVVSFHHLDSVSPVFPNRTRVQALRHLLRPYAADPGRLLQQSLCYDPRRNATASVSWGYSVQIYRGILLPRYAEFPLRTFVSWAASGRPLFMFNTRPVAKDACERPSVYFLDDVAPTDSGVVDSSITSYTLQVRDGSSGSCPAFAAQKVTDVTVFSHDGPLLWEPGDRRRCCEVLSWGDTTLELLLRKCGPTESLVPPV